MRLKQHSQESFARVASLDSARDETWCRNTEPLCNGVPKELTIDGTKRRASMFSKERCLSQILNESNWFVEERHVQFANHVTTLLFGRQKISSSSFFMISFLIVGTETMPTPTAADTLRPLLPILQLRSFRFRRWMTPIVTSIA